MSFAFKVRKVIKFRLSGTNSEKCDIIGIRYQILL